MRLVLVPCVLAAAALPAAADTLSVPSEYPTIQAAIDAAGPGDTVLVGTGIHVESLSVAGKSRLRIRGEEGAILQPADGNGIEAEDCQGLEIADLLVQGGNNGIYVYDSSAVVIRDVVVGGPLYEAIGIVGCTGVRILRCTFLGAGGLGIQEETTTGLLVDRCTFAECQGGISIQAGGEAGGGGFRYRILRNTITGGSAGIDARGEGLLIDRNTIEVFGDLALALGQGGAADGAVVRRNALAAGGVATAVHLQGAGIRFLANVVAGGGVFETAGPNRIEGNTVTGGAYGLLVNGAGGRVRRNTVTDVAGNGIELAGAEFTVERNVVSGCGQSGIQAETARSLYRGNRVEDATYGIVVSFSENVLSGNTVSGEVLLDLWDKQGEGANTYSGNEFRTEHFGPLG